MKLLVLIKPSRGLLHLVCLGLSLCMAYTVSAAAPSDVTNVPDAIKDTLGSSQPEAVAASPDGRILTVFESTQVHFYDAYSVYTGGSDVNNAVTVQCSAVKGLFVTGTGPYLVSVLCGGASSSTSVGNLYQFQIADDLKNDGLLALTVDSATISTQKVMNAIDSSALGGDSIYLAGTGTDGKSGIYKVSATTGSTSAATEVSLFSLTPVALTHMVYVPDLDQILATDATGNVYLTAGTVIQIGSPTCTTRVTDVTTLDPRDLYVVNRNSVLMSSPHTNQVYVISLSTTAVLDCRAYDWGIPSGSYPAGFAHVTLNTASGAQDEDYLYVGISSTGTDSVYIYPTPDSSTVNGVQVAASTPISLSGNLGTFDSVVSADALGRVYFGTSTGTQILAAGPWITYDGTLTQPVRLESGADTVSVTLFSDLEVDQKSLFVVADTTPFNASQTSSNTATVGLSGGGTTGTILKIDVSQLASGAHRIFIYGKDEDGNLGWTSIRVIVPPARVTIDSVIYGNGKLYVTIEKPTDAYDDFVMYATREQPFTSASQFEAGGDLANSSFDVQTSDGVVNFPLDKGGAWPVSLAYSTTNIYWKDNNDGTLTVILCPLENGITYYFMIAAVTDGVAGSYSDVTSGMPQLTCDASCQTGDAGGFCSMVPPSTANLGHRWRFPIFAMLAPAAWALLRRRRMAA